MDKEQIIALIDAYENDKPMDEREQDADIAALADKIMELSQAGVGDNKGLHVALQSAELRLITESNKGLFCPHAKRDQLRTEAAAIQKARMDLDFVRGLYCIDRDPKDIATLDWIRKNAFQVK